jgi:hypothetical protein
LEFEVVIVQQIFVDGRLGIVARVLLVIDLEAKLVFLGTLDDIKALFDFLKERLRRVALAVGSLIGRIVISHIKKLTSPNLVKTIPLSWVFRKHLLHELLELVRVRYALENFPEVLLLRRDETFEVRVSLDSLTERG